MGRIKKVCEFFNLGILVTEPTRVYGGFLHKMWRVDTDKGSYAIKQLSVDLDLTNQSIIKNYETSEIIASKFIKLGIPAIGAVENLGRHLFISEGVGFLVYPWINAVTLGQSSISEKQVCRIAEILAHIHEINLFLPEITQSTFDVHSNEAILSFFDQAARADCSFFSELRQNQKSILMANEAYQQAIPLLQAHLVVSHGDLDKKNVLWDHAGNPILIDWESSFQKVNPAYEMVNAALDWSGLYVNFNKNLFVKMMKAYLVTGGTIVKPSYEAAFHGVVGNWLNWMLYNIQRSCSGIDLEQKCLSTEQTCQVISNILRIQAVMPELMNCSFK